MRRALGLRAACLAAGLLAWAGGTAAQTVERVGSSDVALDRRLARLLASDPLIITEDRRIRSGDTIPRSVLVLDATLIHEGTILGDLVVVDGGAFVRQSVVTGDLVNAGGGLFRSELARVDGTIIDLPEANYRVLRERGRIIIEATRTPARLHLDGFAGVRAPTYDRVNGVTLDWGASYRLPRLRGATPTIQGHAGWRTGAGDPTYGASLDLQAGAMTGEVGYDRAWATREDWAFGDTRNSVNYLWDGDDFRDYYDAERTWVAVSRAFGDVAKSFHATLRVAARLENATTQSAGNPWHIFGDTVRANPPVDDGRITSGLARYDMNWHGWETDLRAAVEYEAGREVQGGEFAFDRVAVWWHFAMHGLLNHTLEIRGYVQQPLGSDTLPMQRWTFVGGVGGLQTLGEGQSRGDHVLFVESSYRIPLPSALSLPVLGTPEIQLVHAVGAAGLADDPRDLVQEVGGRLQFTGLYLKYMLQPAEPSNARLVVGLSWPFGARYPWEI